MRIISGKFKGRFFKFTKSKTTRPLKDAVKENIFNILKHSNKVNIEIDNAKILDLYSGIGSFGIECLSRGAKNVTFVEKDKKIADLLKRNLNNFSLLNMAQIFNEEIDKIHDLLKCKYDIFFLDPPFADLNFVKDLRKIKKKKFYKKKHVVIIHREKNCHDKLEEHLELLLIRKYGRSKIIFGKFN